jgi:hypothetical protein
MNSWKLIGPLVVSASKLGAIEPNRRGLKAAVSKSPQKS